MAYEITSIKKNDDVYYTVNWSPLAVADRWDINAKVPSVAGIYEIYWMDENKRLRMFNVGQTHYGGLRSELRRLTDPDLCWDNINTKKILEDREIWYRYTCSNSADNMADVVWFLMTTFFPEDPPVEHSGRYRKIFLTESAPDRLTWVE